ncbi:MAG: hypothetical protein BWX80_01912 [Candidatus Hydrogenedentes bacterium ADurb.Bin101]|nr:MAG: hypothetical protein BWX80_01912 [Candidatus Hydrogenedentes bacterium ADurb.Bin101]
MAQAIELGDKAYAPFPAEPGQVMGRLLSDHVVKTHVRVGIKGKVVSYLVHQHIYAKGLQDLVYGAFEDGQAFVASGRAPRHDMHAAPGRIRRGRLDAKQRGEENQECFQEGGFHRMVPLVLGTPALNLLRIIIAVGINLNRGCCIRLR